MTKTYLADVISSKDNNFNLIRLLAAFAVLFSHSFALATGDAANEPLRTLIGITPGHIAVDVFFITSGLLVTRSLFYRRNLIEFTAARALRIFPGLITAVLLCVLLGAMLTSLSLSDYFSAAQTKDFIVKNSIIFFGDVQELPGVFANAPFDNSVNGSLWTLPWELRMYAVLGVFGVTTLLLHRLFKVNVLSALAILFLLFCTYNYLQLHFFSDDRGFYYRLYRFGTLFFFGAGYYVMRNKIAFNTPTFIIFSLLLVFSSIDHQLFFIFYTALLPYIVLYLAYIPTGKIRLFNRYGDYSYGIYIYAWPMQQLIAVSIENVSVPTMILTSTAATFCLAYFSWHIVESRALSLKKHFKPHPWFDIVPAKAQ